MVGSVSLEQLKKLRNQTQASIADCRRALEESNGDYPKALTWLQKHGIEEAEKKSQRETKGGIIDTYIHHTMRSGATVAIACETDFVARTDEFKKLAHEVAMQVTSTDPQNVDALLAMQWVKDPTKTVLDLIKEHIAKFGENITIKEFKRFEV